MWHYITETTDVNSTIEGYFFECEALSYVKREAKKQQYFYGTVLKIHDSSKNLICYVNDGKNNRWISA